MGLGPRIDLRQSQSLVLTPQLTQAIKLLQLSNLELEAYIAEEMSKNPLIEEIGGEEEGEAPGAAPVVLDVDGGGDDAPPDPGADELIAALNASDDQPLDIDWRDQALETDSYADVAGSASAGTSDQGFDFDRLEAGTPSLAEHLLGQLHGLGGPDGALARAITEMLDETGYLSVPLSDIADDFKVSRADAERALGLVQSLDPPGIGARNLAECLALQAKAADRYDPAMARLIDNLELLSRGQMGALKRICGVDDEDLADMVRELRAFDPKPGCSFSGEAADDVTPDVFIRRTANGYAVELNAATLPRLLV
ncbi:MAG: RNA polymerase sigma-54 factor, partial [Sphingomicrobium sp.]